MKLSYFSVETLSGFIRELRLCDLCLKKEETYFYCLALSNVHLGRG